MQNGMDPNDWWAAHAALAWQIEMGADEAILDAPVDRYALGAAEAAPEQERAASAPGAKARRAAPPPPPPPLAPKAPADDPVARARAAVAGVADLAGLRAALEAFDGGALQAGARSCVFADGNPQARVMVVGEAPGRDEDREGRPFVGRAGRLLDAMFAAIGLSRTAEDPDRALYITNVLPYRPEGNRTPTPDEVATYLPFLTAHVELAAPEILVVMGNTPALALLGRQGITRMRGNWDEALGRPVLPMFHPAYLLRQPLAKREAWADLLSLRARLGGD